MTTRTKYWLCQAAGWGAYCVIGITGTAQYVSTWMPLVAGYLLYFFYSIGLTHLFRLQIRQRGWLNLPRRAWLPRLMLGVVLIGIVQTLLVIAISTTLAGGGWLWSSAAWMWAGTTTATGVWTAFYVYVTAKRRHEERELTLQLALREAELRALESQINPHFLFNCLNSIRALVPEDPPRAQDMITRLANVLRYSLRHDGQHTVELASELEAVGDYLALEGARFEERLRVTMEIDPATATVPVPRMLLQTLVENAVKHGVAHLTGPGEVIVRATNDGAATRLEVENTGQLSPTTTEGNGMGLANARERLKLLYGPGTPLDLSNGNGRVLATVRIPKKQ